MFRLEKCMGSVIKVYKIVWQSLEILRLNSEKFFEVRNFFPFPQMFTPIRHLLFRQTCKNFYVKTPGVISGQCTGNYDLNFFFEEKCNTYIF